MSASNTVPQDRPNPLATENIGKLILKFAIPGIIANLVNASYNIVDQIFIGQKIGMLGNAATNVAFPINTLTASIALLCGVGAAANFNLNLGAGRKEKAMNIAGNGITVSAVISILLMGIVLIFLEPLLRFFGSTEQVLPYALTFTRITSYGIPFMVITLVGSNLIRADSSPTYSMFSVMAGAILNVILAPLFLFGFDMGIEGAAYATLIGQFVSFLLVVRYLFKFKTERFTKKDLIPKKAFVISIASLGMAASLNQIALTITQIVLNNTLTFYGAQSEYGSDIPLACVGVITKVNAIFLSIAVGLAQGCQPISGFNYGAKNYDRVKQTLLTALASVTAMSVLIFACYQIFPRQIVSIFGTGSEQYYAFAEEYFRIFLLLTFINGIQPVTANFFTSIGMAKKGLLLSMTRQIMFLIPLILIFPIFLGIDGVMYAGPIADCAAAVVAIVLITKEIKNMNGLKLKQNS